MTCFDIKGFREIVPIDKWRFFWFYGHTTIHLPPANLDNFKARSVKLRIIVLDSPKTCSTYFYNIWMKTLKTA
jgi:hypothetical protein